MKSSIINLVFLLFSNYSIAESPCLSVQRVPFKAKNISECQKKYKDTIDSLAECQNTVWLGAIASMREDCSKSAMNTSLDKRLLLLKDTNKQLFKKEMHLQKIFNQTIEAHCDTDRCRETGGTVWGLANSSCINEAYEYRTLQSELINSNKLALTLNNKKSKKLENKNIDKFNAYVKLLCLMPANVWTDKKIPDNCEEKALIELNNMEFTDDVCDLT